MKKLISFALLIALITSLTLVGLAKPAPQYHYCNDCKGEVEAKFTIYCQQCGGFSGYYCIYVCSYSQKIIYHTCDPQPQFLY